MTLRVKIEYNKKKPVGIPSGSGKSYFDRLKIIIRKLDKGDLQILEIGTYKGKGSLLLSEFGEVTSIDRWEDDAVYKEWCETKKKMNSYAQLRQDSKIVLPVFGNESFDFIYVDGDHTRFGAAFDMKESLRLIKNGGIICCHDCFGRARDYDRDFLEEYDGVYIKCNRLGYNIHTGVILAVEDIFNNTGEILIDFFWKRINK